MANSDITRKIAFNLYPADEPGDRLACTMIDEARLKERGRTMRSLLLTGAAFAAIDRRIPNLIAELATESITLCDIQRIISSVIPDAFPPDETLIQKVISRLENNGSESINSMNKNTLTEDQLDKTRRNSSTMFPDD